jgi:hypothetical protein
MIVKADERRRRRRMAAAAVLAAMAATFPTGDTRSQQLLTWERLSQLSGGFDKNDFPYVLHGQTIRARFEGMQRSHVMADGARQTLFIYRATNCTVAGKAGIDCGGEIGPEVLIPVLLVTPASKPRPSPPELVLKSQRTSWLADYVPELPQRVRPSGNAKAVWIRLKNPAEGALKLATPVAPAALLLCVPPGECQNNVPLANLADAPDRTAAVAPAEGSRPPGNPAGPGTAGLGTASPPPDQPPPATANAAGRWLLALYGPQSIGIGIDASARVIADAQDQILNSLTAFLDDFHAKNFPTSHFDLALMTSPEASLLRFPEKNVLTGKFRQPSKTDRFRIDHEGDRRLAAFLSGPSSSGGEASFKAVGDMIKLYAQMPGDASGQRLPLAIYVGAARPLPNSCAEWKKMTADLAGLPSRPRVFGIVFANASAGQIDRQLGSSDRGADEPIARTRASTCMGANDSALLYVPFPDLISHAPETVLQQAFAVVKNRVAQLQN